MMGTMNIQSLREFMRTTEDANSVQQLFANLSGSLFHDGRTPEQILETQLPYNQLEALRRTAFENGVNTQDKDQMREFFLKLKETVQTLPVVHIMLAFEPTKPLMDSIYDWFYANTKQAVILDIIVDTTLIAGGIISYNGKVSDHSINSEVLKLQLEDE